MVELTTEGLTSVAMTVRRGCWGVSSEVRTCSHCGIATLDRGRMMTDRIGRAIIAFSVNVGVHYLWTPVIEPLGRLVMSRLLADPL